jgi:hypothetical protein
MGKSIRSKSKRKFRALRRKNTYGPAARKKQMESLSNLRRCIGNNQASRETVDKLKALLRGDGATTDTANEALPDASEMLGLTQWKEEMDQAEKEALHRVNGHFSFKTTAAPDYKEPVLWKTSEADLRMTQQLMKEKELLDSSMVIDTDGSNNVNKGMSHKQRAARKVKKKRR